MDPNHPDESNQKPDLPNLPKILQKSRLLPDTVLLVKPGLSQEEYLRRVQELAEMPRCMHHEKSESPRRPNQVFQCRIEQLRRRRLERLESINRKDATRRRSQTHLYDETNEYKASMTPPERPRRANPFFTTVKCHTSKNPKTQLTDIPEIPDINALQSQFLASLNISDNMNVNNTLRPSTSAASTSDTTSTASPTMGQFPELLAGLLSVIKHFSDRTPGAPLLLENLMVGLNQPLQMPSTPEMARQRVEQLAQFEMLQQMASLSLDQKKQDEKDGSPSQQP